MSAPFVRSAGGKREQAPLILSLMPPIEAFSTYVEPFVGGGAVFFALWNEGRLNDKTVVLGDGDPDLVNLYAAVRDDMLGLMRGAARLVAQATRSGEARSFYEKERALWNQHARYRTPERHLYLRRACFNGLWRTNRSGELNTPWRGEAPSRVDETKLLRAMAALRNPFVELLDWDFRRYDEDDGFFVDDQTLVYLDPPYLGDADDFTGYLPGGWEEEDMRDLLKLCATWSDRGAHVVLSHADNEKTRALVAELWPDAELHATTSRRSINSDGEGRGHVPEVVIVGKAVVDTLHATRHTMHVVNGSVS